MGFARPRAPGAGGCTWLVCAVRWRDGRVAPSIGSFRRMLVSFMNYRELSRVVATMTRGLGARTSQREGCAAALLGGILWALTGCIAPPTVLPNTCGDGFVSEDEECDDPEMSVDCNIDC